MYTFDMQFESKIYTAKWGDYNITLEKNISEAGSVSGNGKFVAGMERTITAVTNEGYTWLGWYDDETKVSEGTSLTYNFAMPLGNKTYYARWEAITYTVYLDVNEGNELSTNSANIIYGTEYILQIPTRDGCIFLGWFTEQDGGIKLTNDLGVSLNIWNNSNIEVVYAHWAKYYNITYILNGGTNNSNNSNRYNSFEGAILYSPTKNGYYFDGWYISSTFSGSQMQRIEKDTTGNISLYAKWSAKTYIITLSTSKGSLCSTTANVTFGQFYNLPVPSGSNATFIGWRADNEVSTGINCVTDSSGSSKNSYSYYENKTYYACFEASLPATVTLTGTATNTIKSLSSNIWLGAGTYIFSWSATSTSNYIKVNGTTSTTGRTGSITITLNVGRYVPFSIYAYGTSSTTLTVKKT
jgi:uncharacterized repeat protein (TIGR02543 family)